MSELVIRAPLARLVAPPAVHATARETVPASEAARATGAPRRARPWHLPEDDGDPATRATLGRVSGWFMPLG